jgi:hypothetical protein
MAGNDLTVFIGADATAFIKGMDEAINKATGKEGSGKFAGLLKDFVQGGIKGLVSGIGAAFGPEGEVIAEVVNLLIDGIGQMIARAKEFRNLSYATGLTTGQLMELESLAESTGISLQTLASSFHEFNKRMATAQIRGSEFNAAAAKLGLDMNKLKDRTLTAKDAMIELAKAHKAGTDAATLAYYGNMLFGSSFEQLLPAIKRGTSEMIALADLTVRNTDTSTRALASISDYWSAFVGIMKAGFYEFLGQTVERWKGMYEMLAVLPTTIITSKLFGGREAAHGLNASLMGRTDEEKNRMAQLAAQRMSEDDAKKFLEEFDKILGEGGNKLNPFGLQSAQGASQLQQMGGGDIVSAIAFTPLERIANATEETAKNTKQKGEPNLIAELATKSLPFVIGY